MYYIFAPSVRRSVRNVTAVTVHTVLDMVQIKIMWALVNKVGSCVRGEMSSPHSQQLDVAVLLIEAGVDVDLRCD